MFVIFSSSLHLLLLRRPHSTPAKAPLTSEVDSHIRGTAHLALTSKFPLFLEVDLHIELTLTPELGVHFRGSTLMSVMPLTPEVNFTLEIEPLVPVHQFDKLPSYFIFAGLVFVPLSQPYLHEYGEDWYNTSPRRLCERALREMPNKPGEQLVILSQVLLYFPTYCWPLEKQKYVSCCHFSFTSRVKMHKMSLCISVRHSFACLL
ncbi:hypothetical protein GIB67_031778 [Kingdonia uniflora]|uniref:Protease Do-like PDZ domain-containing protein n=1 Tax=Kingdonia uniflora TaxID=39325 RepID=A0A7J7L4J4_9MAGN|nr:hypothetical protein GIB67_031778 [Kingdonia uniflora]